MKVETIIPEKDRKQIEKWKSKIQEIMESYFDDIETGSAFSIREITKSIRAMENDIEIKMYEKLIENVYRNMVPKTVLIAESEEDKRMLDAMLNKNR